MSAVAIIALVAFAITLSSLIVSLVALTKLQRIRRDQSTIFAGGQKPQDLVRYSADLARDFAALQTWTEDQAARFEERIRKTEQKLLLSISGCGLVHFDAYGDLSGKQSTAIALIDRNSCGIVISSIHHRDQARVYTKRLQHGNSKIPLSPEESDALAQAEASITRHDQG